MPFNKGDFTQLGVAGHVNANLRLNEKRLVNVDMTSNENAEGCTITGTVTDRLNNKVYNIGSAPSGNIEITENGENINVAAYATATVNVSGGGDSLCKMTLTVVNNAGDEVTLFNYIRTITLLDDGGFLLQTSPTVPEGSSTYDLLYCDVSETNPVLYTTGSVNPMTPNLTNLVNCQLVTEGEFAGYIKINDITANSSATLTITE